MTNSIHLLESFTLIQDVRLQSFFQHYSPYFDIYIFILVPSANNTKLANGKCTNQEPNENTNGEITEKSINHTKDNTVTVMKDLRGTEPKSSKC